LQKRYHIIFGKVLAILSSFLQKNKNTDGRKIDLFKADEIIVLCMYCYN